MSDRYIPRFKTIFAASWASDLDLKTVSGMPPYAPYRLEIHNDETTTQDLVVKGDWSSSTDNRIEVPADSIRVFREPVKQITTSGTETIASVTAYWKWDGVGPLNA